MSKGAYIGINNIAHKIKKGYIGVDGVARRIKKAYIGVGGVARPCWSEGKIGYYGVTTAGLTNPVRACAASHIGNYALFGGGVYNNVTTYSSVIDGYSRNLTKFSQINTLSVARYCLYSTHNDGHVFFAGGKSGEYTFTGVVDAYDMSMTKKPVADFASSPWAASHIGKYAVFFGVTDGYYSVCTYAYDDKLTQIYAGLDQELSALSVGNLHPTASTEYGAFVVDGGGALNMFDDQLNRKSVMGGFQSLGYQAATSIGEYAVFAGGSRGNNYAIATMQYVDKELTVRVGTSLGKGRSCIAATHVGNYAIFAFGYSYYNIGQYADFYDINLTRTFLDNSSSDSTNRRELRATHIGDYALFASGGSYDFLYSNEEDATVRVYAIM